jgi:hypothetical protein
MIGGYTKSSRLALLAAMGLIGGVASAQAADLGGNCCADLEERVAELEATTARKGNRKVSLEVSGFVHQGIMWFDGAAGNDSTSTKVKESNTYVGINRPEANSRFRFVGKASINAKMNAGYLMEFQVNAGSNSDSFAAATDDTTNGLSVRHSAWWIEHKDMGKVWVGQTSQATDGITEIQLSNTGHFANQNTAAGAGLLAVSNAVGGTNRSLFNFMGGISTDNAQIGEGNRRNVVKYESPALAGFILSAAAGEDDMWDVALRYAGEFSGIKVAFGIGYESTTEGPSASTERNCITSGIDSRCQQLGLSGSVMHVPTGLFVNGFYGWRKDDNVTVANQDDTSTRWGVMAGIEQNWLGIGKTTVYGEYVNWDIGANNTFNSTGLAGAEMTMWGLGLNQSIDAAAMDLYVQYRSYQDISTFTNAGVSTGFSDVQMIMAGGIIKF